MATSSTPPIVTSLRSDGQTPLLFTTNMGLEDIAIAEFRERAVGADIDVLDSDDAPLDLSSYALVETNATPSAALNLARQMRSVHHVLAPLYTFELPDGSDAALDTIRTTLESLEVGAMETAQTFRVTTVRQGDHDFTSIDVQREAGAGLEAHYGTTVDLEEYETEVRVDVHDDRCLVSVQHTREALSRRQLEGFQPRAALKANVAYALLRLAHLDTAPDVLLDPFCGSGTILLEAAELWPETESYGNDWDDEAIAGARFNVKRAELDDRITIRGGDVWHLAQRFSDVTADLIVTNPPFGVRLASSMDFFPFYRRVLEQMQEVLRPGGRVVMLVLRQSPFNRALDEIDGFTTRHVRAVEIGGLYPRAFVLQKN